MEQITCYDFIKDISIEIRSLNEGYITNFFLSQEKCNLLINNNLLYYVCFKKCIFILFKDYNFYHIYYICSNENELNECLNDIISKYSEYIYITDIIGSEANIQGISSIFSKSGFEKYKLLYRMNRINNLSETQVIDSKVENALITHTEQIHFLLEKYFDKYCEQIPMIKEINNFIEKENVLILLEKDVIIGFVIFEINGMTSYLRYWFVLPEYREKKIGSVLLREFFNKTKETKRQLFWVIAENENAIIRYKHYGFKSEDMFDQVMIRH